MRCAQTPIFTCARRLLLWAAVAIGSSLASSPLRAALQPTSPAPGDPVARALQSPLAAVGAAIRAQLASEADRDSASRDLDRLYGTTIPAPLWIDSSGRPNRMAGDGLTRLAAAADDGLDPQDYDAAELARRAAALTAARWPDPADAATFDLALSESILRYLRHLHLGRVDPRALGFQLRLSDDSHDFVPLLRSAVTEGRIASAAAGLAPPFAQYRALRAALARYRALDSAGIGTIPPLTAAIHPGEPYPHTATLAHQLRALGDLPAEMAPIGDTALYEGAVVTAVQRFQRRHGLTPDGVLGRATQAALRVPLAWRVRQIELALERLRWLPDLGSQRLVVLNIPMFTLWGWDSVSPTGAPSFGMRAIVGRALRTQTPVFVDEMQHVVFRPYWNVPRSIVRNEILPALARDPNYLRRNEMEMVRGQGDDTRAEADTADNHVLLRQGILRLRQRPGPRNSLGLLKFVFPNDVNVYMHGTPAQELFAHSRRDFSHGCVRVEDPAALAAWVLKEEPGWTRERIDAAMSDVRPQRVVLTTPIQVILFYLTAAVLPEDGTVQFAEDIYRHDLRLDRALTRAVTMP